jgi:opacity protein-like surface antigen
MSARNTRAEEIEHKFRIGFSAGGYNITDQQHSAAGNFRLLLKPDGEIDSFLQDPRNDSGAFSDFGLESQLGGTLSVSYGLNRFWFVEGSLGYRRGKVGNVQVQAFFDGAPTTTEQPNNYAIYNLNAGTITQIPLQLTTGIRFRPKASFNPYLCLGVGYSFNSFSTSAELDDLSLSLDQSTGGFARLNGITLDPAESVGALSGITVDAPDAPEWHLGGGFEYTVARRWTIFLDARYTIYSGKFHMTVNGSDELGISVPNDQRFLTDPDALGPFGGYQITRGGLIDGGSLVPKAGFPANDNCVVNPGHCEFTGPPDGVKDTGFYYVSAGRVRYDAASYQIGFKFTF